MCLSYWDATSWSLAFFHHSWPASPFCQDFLLCILCQYKKVSHCYCLCCGSQTLGVHLKNVHSFSYSFQSFLTKKGRWMYDMDTPGKADPTKTRAERVGMPYWFTHRNTCVYLSCLKGATVWSVALVADRRKLVFVIKTHGPDCELVLWDHITLLGSTIFRVACQNKRKMRLLKLHTH